MSKPIVQVRNLRPGFDIEGKMAWVVRGVSFDIFPEHLGPCWGIRQRKICDASITAASHSDPPGKIAEGEVLFDGQDLLKLSYPEMAPAANNHDFPRTRFAQPGVHVGMQVMEAVAHHENLTKRRTCAGR